MLRIFVCCFCLNFVQVFSQDFHFTQYNRVGILVNPAITGVFGGWERFCVSHRNQWLGANTQFTTSAASAEMTVGKGYRNEKSYLGFGFMFVNDVGGDANFGLRNGGITISGVIPVNRLHTFSAGLQTSFGNRVADLTNLTFLSQWNGSAFDPTILSGEDEALVSFSYLDAGLGFHYRYGKEQTKVIRERDFSIEAGASVSHINRPRLRYSNITSDRLYMKFNVYTNVFFTFSEVAGMEFNLLQTKQGKQYETVGGIFFKTRFKAAAHVTRKVQDSYIGFGTYVQSSGVLAPAVTIDWGGFKLGLSYDLSVSKIRQAYTGSAEISLSYTTTKESIFGRR